jgi:Mg-chelatase subunit ChlD
MGANTNTPFLSNRTTKRGTCVLQHRPREKTPSKKPAKINREREAVKEKKEQSQRIFMIDTSGSAKNTG